MSLQLDYVFGSTRAVSIENSSSPRLLHGFEERNHYKLMLNGVMMMMMMMMVMNESWFMIYIIRHTSPCASLKSSTPTFFCRDITATPMSPHSLIHTLLIDLKNDTFQ